MRTILRRMPKIIHTPGKFIGSRNSSRYHKPKCEWAGRITPKMKVWFSSRKEAERKGYEPAACCRR